MHTSHLNHLDIGLRLAGYCTLVAFFRIVELNQDGRMQHVVFGLSQSTLEEAQDLRGKYIIIIGSISLYLTYFIYVCSHRMWQDTVLHQDMEDVCTCGLTYLLIIDTLSLCSMLTFSPHGVALIEDGTRF